MTRSLGRRRGLLAAVPQLLGIAPPLAALVAWRDRLPDPLASHFGPYGLADGFMGWGAVFGLITALGVGLAVLFGICARSLTTQTSAAVSTWDTGRWFIAIAWGTAAFLGTVLFGCVTANVDLRDAAAATMPWWAFSLGLLGAAGAGAIGWLVTPKARGAAQENEPVPAIRLDESERVSWSRDMGPRWMPVLAATLIAGGIALGAAMTWVGGVSTASAGVVVLLVGSARVTVDRRGVTAALGILGLPRLHVPAGEITSATVADVSPSQFGGWGYRIVPGARGIITRSGPALVITRRSGPRLTITVDDAETAAGLLNGLSTRG